jgi:hypothetical protein
MAAIAVDLNALSLQTRLKVRDGEINLVSAA